jgi:hypothetical protein
MPRGGHNRKPARLRALYGRKATVEGDGTSIRPRRVPPAPKDLSEVERRVWNELRPQVQALGIYTAATFTAMTLLVKSLALAEQVNDLPASAGARILQSASQQLASFGLTPLAAERMGVAVDRSPRESKYDEFLTYPGKPVRVA